MVEDFGRKAMAAVLPGPYLAGRCTAFAIAVHRRTGWPLAVLRTEYGAYAHCGCVHPDGHYVDARGLLDEHGFRDMFGGGAIVTPVTEEDALREHPQSEELIARAAIHADMLLDMPGVPEHRRRLDAFASALADLCREHGIWLRGPGSGVSEHFVAYDAYGEEGPFEVTQMPAGGAMVRRTLGPDRD